MIVDWEFDDPIQFVGPTDTITMLATFTNSSTADEVLDGGLTTSAEILDGTLLGAGNPYDFSFGSAGDIFAELSPMSIGPGESFGFTFGVLTPKGGSAPIGTFNSPGAGLTIDGTQYGGFGHKTFQVTVTPEPATLAIWAGLGGIGLAVVRRRRGAFNRGLRQESQAIACEGVKLRRS